MEAMDKAEDQIKTVLRQRHKISGTKEDDFTVRNLTSIMEMMAETTGTITLLLGSIAAISLLVGGIGIMNIMMVSVTERTREIGIRKALDATYHNIMLQFLIESIVIGIFGGTGGVILGLLAAFAISFFGELNTVVSALSIFVSFGFSIAVGLFFGIYPARKAALLDPIEALRFE
jgi:ABC-type transport system, involved in lipoprotein release, permease component